MSNKNREAKNRRGFAAMDPERRSALAKKGGHASRKIQQLKVSNLEEELPARGFAAMDLEKRKQIAKRGGSVSRRNRVDHKNQIVIL